MADRNLRKRLVILFVAAIAVVFYLQIERERRHHAYSGTLESDEARVASRSGGRVVALRTAEGDAVTNGQPLVELEADELQARRDQAAAVLAELEAGPREQEVNAARADWEAAQAELTYAESEARRMADLVAKKVVSDTDWDAADSRAKALARRVDAARERHELLLAGTRPEQVAQARARLAELDAQMAEMTVRAPADCDVETLHVKVGDVVVPNAPVATLVLKNAPWLRLYVPATRLGQVNVGGEVRLRIDAFPGEPFTGRIEQVSRQAEFTPRNVQTPEERVKQVYGVKIRVADPGRKLRAGMTAEVRLEDKKNR
jgi:multidrug resistance efflux pump